MHKNVNTIPSTTLITLVCETFLTVLGHSQTCLHLCFITGVFALIIYITTARFYATVFQTCMLSHKQPKPDCIHVQQNIWLPDLLKRTEKTPFTALNINISFNCTEQFHTTVQWAASMKGLPRWPNNNANFKYYAKDEIGRSQCNANISSYLSSYLLNLQSKFEQSSTPEPCSLVPRTTTVAYLQVLINSALILTVYSFFTKNEKSVPRSKAA